jgi:hypothetical protein
MNRSATLKSRSENKLVAKSGFVPTPWDYDIQTLKGKSFLPRSLVIVLAFSDWRLVSFFVFDFFSIYV